MEYASRNTKQASLEDLPNRRSSAIPGCLCPLSEIQNLSPAHSIRKRKLRDSLKLVSPPSSTKSLILGTPCSVTNSDSYLIDSTESLHANSIHQQQSPMSDLHNLSPQKLETTTDVQRKSITLVSSPTSHDICLPLCTMETLDEECEVTVALMQQKEDVSPLVHNVDGIKKENDVHRRESMEALKLEESESISHNQCVSTTEEFELMRCAGSPERTRSMIAPESLEQRNYAIPDTTMDNSVHCVIDDDVAHAEKDSNATRDSLHCLAALQTAVREQGTKEKVDDSSTSTNILYRVTRRPSADHKKQNRRREQSLPPRLEGAVGKSNISASSRLDALVAEFRHMETTSQCTHNNNDDNIIFIPLDKHELSLTYADLRAQACEQLETIKDDVEDFNQLKATTIDHINDLVSTPQSRRASIQCDTSNNHNSNEHKNPRFLSTQAMFNRLRPITPDIARSLEQGCNTSPSLDLSVRRSVQDFVRFWENGANGCMISPLRDLVAVDNTSMIGSPERSRPFAPVPMQCFRISLQSDDVTRSPPIASSPIHVARFLEDNSERDKHMSSQSHCSLSPNMPPLTVTSLGAPDDALHQEQPSSELTSQESLQQMHHSFSMPHMTLSSSMYAMDAREALSDAESGRVRYPPKCKRNTLAATRAIDAALPNADSPRLTLTDEMPFRSSIVARLFHSPSPSSSRHAHERHASRIPKRHHGLASPSIINPSFSDLSLTESSAFLNDSTHQSDNIVGKLADTSTLPDHELSSCGGDCKMQGVDNDHVHATNIPRTDDEFFVHVSEKRLPDNEVSSCGGASNLQGDDNEHMNKMNIPRIDSTFSVYASEERLPDSAASAFLKECPTQLDEHLDEGICNVLSVCSDVCNSDAETCTRALSKMLAGRNALQKTTTPETMNAQDEWTQEAQELVGTRHKDSVTSQHETSVHSTNGESADSLKPRNDGDENAALEELAASQEIRGHADSTVDSVTSVDMTTQQLPDKVTLQNVDQSVRVEDCMNEPNKSVPEGCSPPAVRKSRVIQATLPCSTQQNLQLRVQLKNTVALGAPNVQSSISVKATTKKIGPQAAPKAATRHLRTASMPRTSVRSTQSTVSSSSAGSHHPARSSSACRGTIKSNSNHFAVLPRSTGPRGPTKSISSASSASATDGQSVRRPSSVSHAFSKSNLSSVDSQPVGARSAGRSSVKPHDSVPSSKTARRKARIVPRALYTKGLCKGFTNDLRASQQPSETTRATVQTSRSSNASTKRPCDALSQAAQHHAPCPAVSSSAQVKRRSRASRELLTMERLDDMLLPTRQAMSQIEALVLRPVEQDACHPSASFTTAGDGDKTHTALSTFRKDRSPSQLLPLDRETQTTPPPPAEFNVSPSVFLRDDEAYTNSLIHEDLRSILASTRSHATQNTAFTLQEPHRSSLVSKHESQTTSLTTREPLLAPSLVPSHESETKSLTSQGKESHVNPSSAQNHERRTSSLAPKTHPEFISPSYGGSLITDALSVTHPRCSPDGLNDQVTGWRPLDTARHRRNDEVARLEAEIMKRASSAPRSQPSNFRARVPPKSTYRKCEWPNVQKRELTSPTRVPHLYTAEPARVRKYKHCCKQSPDSERPFRASPVPASLYDPELPRRPSPAPLTSPQTPKCFKRSSTPQASFRHRRDHHAREQQI
eukprot:GEMP01000775.1.p1 GENE.GEMP01000775.1~~GEMP01000775.1.p1  ORF type:complete len:1661 (+),score=339.41 GEMP01000775.1:164-5146(+)